MLRNKRSGIKCNQLLTTSENTRTLHEITSKTKTKPLTVVTMVTMVIYVIAIIKTGFDCGLPGLTETTFITLETTVNSQHESRELFRECC